MGVVVDTVVVREGVGNDDDDRVVVLGVVVVRAAKIDVSCSMCAVVVVVLQVYSYM